jgi:hypothetical protein
MSLKVLKAGSLLFSVNISAVAQKERRVWFGVSASSAVFKDDKNHF